MKTSRNLFVILAFACAFFLPARPQAGQVAFTDSFMLDKCTFESRGRNPYFILEPGYQLIFEGEEGKALVRLEITVLNETQMVAGVRTRVVQELETHDSQVVERRDVG